MKRWAGNILLVLGGILAAFVLLEIGLRVAGVSYPSFYRRDLRTGASLRPRAAGRWRAEGNAFVRINRDGWRDRDHARAKPEGTVRIAVLGDSYPEAFQVPMEEAFWAVMEKELSAGLASGGKTSEALNFGVSGYGTAQELLTLRHRVWEYDPDVVVLAFVTGNDVRNNLRALENDPGRPYFVYQGDALVLDNAYLGSWHFGSPGRLRLIGLLSRASDFSRVLQVANEAKNVIRTRREARRQAEAARAGVAGQGEANAPDSQPGTGNVPAPGTGSPRARTAPPRPWEAGLDDMIYREPSDPRWEEAWRVTEGLIALMNDEVRARDARLLVVTLSNGIQVHPDPAIRRDYLACVGGDDLFYPDRRIEALCARKGIPVLALAPRLQEHAERNRVFLHGFGSHMGSGHWNRDGHRLAGEAIAAAVRRLLPEAQVLRGEP